MFSKYLKAHDSRARYIDSLRCARQLRLERARLNAISLRTQLAEAEEALKVLQEPFTPPLPPVEPSFRLLECAAYLADCADGNEVPTFKDAEARGYMVTGSSLASALKDAIEEGWIGHPGDFRIYWRDAGLSSDCPLVALARKRRESRAKS